MGVEELIHEQLQERRAENDWNEKWENKGVTHAEPRRDTCNNLYDTNGVQGTEGDEMVNGE